MSLRQFQALVHESTDSRSRSYNILELHCGKLFTEPRDVSLIFDRRRFNRLARGCKPKRQKIPSAFRCLAQSFDGSDANQGTHLSNGNGVQLRQAFGPRQALMDEDGVDPLQVGQHDQLLQFSPRSIGPVCQTKRLSLKSWSDLRLSFRSGDSQSDQRVELRARFFARGCPRFAEIFPDIHDRTRR